MEDVMETRLPDTTFSVNGVEVMGAVVAQIINAVTHPDPTRHVWYRFERRDNTVIVHQRVDELP